MRTMSGICYDLGTREGPILGAEDPQVVMFTVLGASKGEIVEVGKANKALANRAIIPDPQETVPTNTSGPGVQRGPRGREPRNCNKCVLLRLLCFILINLILSI